MSSGVWLPVLLAPDAAIDCEPEALTLCVVERLRLAVANVDVVASAVAVRVDVNVTEAVRATEAPADSVACDKDGVGVKIGEGVEAGAVALPVGKGLLVVDVVLEAATT